MAIYKVKKGDTLSGIAKQFGTTYQEIAKQNGISNPNKINVGQVLTIGGTAPKTTIPKTTTPKTTTPKTTTPKTTTPKDFTYKEFKPDAATTTADKNRQNLESQKPDDFTYSDYEESDVVKQAKSILEQQINNKPGEYQSNWQTRLDDTINKILNREKFTYDLNGDALYQQYKDQYMLQGQQAMMDTMGQAQAMTGGYGNSYAQTVGQQTYQGYLQQLNDKVPELYQLAYDQYKQEGQDLYNQYGLIADREEMDYGRHRDTVSDWRDDRNYYTDVYNNERNFDYGEYTDDRSFDYGVHRDEVADWQNDLNRAYSEYWNLYNRDYTQYTNDKTFDYNQFSDNLNYEYQVGRDAVEDANTAKKYAYDTAMGMLSLGVTPSAQMLKDAGISASDARDIVNKVLANEAKAASSGSGSSGSSGSKGSNKGGSGFETDEDTGSTLLWNFTGTYDDNGNRIFRNSDGKTQAFGEGINPYTGIKHNDAKHGTFSNGYQPNNIGGTKLKNSGMSTNITGKNQTIWEANGKYWLWRGDLNEYVEVDISDLD